jgi:CubicO group peptidase (beta-lactamase class C family)
LKVKKDKIEMITKRQLLGLCVALLFSAASCVATFYPLAATEPSSIGTPVTICGLDAAVSARLDEYLTALTDVGRFSGTMLLAQNGTVVLSKGYGMANIEFSVPNAPQTVFPIGSNTKQFTAAAILKLQEQGRLNVSDPITHYIPDAPAQWGPIRIYQLLNHTSGMPHDAGFDITDPANIALPDLVKLFASVPLDFEPGTNYSYSNNGYITLSYIVEQASGRSYDQYLQEDLFQPLGMNSTGQDNARDVFVDRASGYTTMDGERIHYDLQNIHNSYGAGSLHSTIEDLNKWENAFHTPGAILSSVSLDAMLESGYGIVKTTVENRTVIGHAGRNFGFISQTLYFPDDGVTILFLSNYDRTEVGRLIEDLMAIVFDKPYCLPQKIERQETPLNTTELQDYTGTYKLVAADWNYTIFLDGSQLFYTSSVPKETVKLFYEGNDAFFMTAESPDSFIFSRDNAGKVDGFNMTTGTGTDRAVKVS